MIQYAQQIMSNKIKQANQATRGRIEFSRNLNAKSKLTVFTVHKMIEKIGEYEANKASSSHVFAQLVPSTAIHKVSTENQTPQKRQTPIIYTSNKRIETMFTQSRSKFRYETDFCPQVEKAIKNIQKKTRQCRTIESDRQTEFNKNYAQKMKFMSKKVKNLQTYSYESLNSMNFGLNIKQIKNIHVKEVKRQKNKMRSIIPKESEKNLLPLKTNTLDPQTESQFQQVITLQNLNQKNLIIKQISDSKQKKKTRIKTKVKDDSSFKKKVNRMFNCFDLILNSYHVRFAKQPKEIEDIYAQSREGTNRTFYKNRKNRMKYTYYVGGGNNANLIRSILRKRSWWVQVDNMAQAKFVWTQLRSEAFVQKMQSATQNWNSQITFYEEDIQSTQNLSSLRASFKRTSSTATTDICSLKESCLGYIFHQKHSKKYGTVLDPHEASLRLQKIERPLLLHNHYSQNFMFGNKNALYYNISNYYSFCHKNLANIVPLTFYLQKGNQKAFAQFQKTFSDPKFRGSVWIMKPAENSNRGQGIEVTNLLNMIKSKVNSQKKLIVQYYIRNLMLYNNRKFDIRTYMMALTINGRIKIFWYDQGYIRTSSEFYDEDNLSDPFIHLTNDAVQKNGENYGRYQIGNKLSYSQFQRYLQSKYQRDGWQVSLLHDQMKQLARDAAKAIYCRLNPNNKAFTFQLFGLDFMVDNTFKPYLIEINTNPCLQLSSPVLQRLIPRMMQNMFRLFVDPIFRPQFDFTATKSESYYIYDQTFLQRNKFCLIFDQKFDRDFQWQQRCKKMRGIQWSTAEQQEFQDEGNFIMVQY